MRRTIFRQVQTILLVLCGMVLANAVYATTITPMISVGAGIMAAIKSDGSLWWWGNMYFSDNASEKISTPNPKQIGNDFIKVSVTDGGLLAIKNDGSLWGIGRNKYGQLGNGNVISQSTLIQIGTDTWKEISVGGYHTVGIKTDGTLWAWGANDSGQLAIGFTSNELSLTPKQIGTDNNWSAIAAGGEHTLALKNDGTMWAWGAAGSNRYGQIGNGQSSGNLSLTQIGTGKNWKVISAGSLNSAAIDTGGTLWIWGLTPASSSTWGPTTSLYIPTVVGKDYQAVSVGPTIYAIKSDGSLYGWGYNYYGEVGQGSSTIEKPTLITSGVSFISGGDSKAAAISGFDLYTWGWGEDYALGDGGATRNVPTVIGRILSISGENTVYKNSNNSYYIYLSHFFTSPEKVIGTLALDNSTNAKLSNSTLIVGDISNEQTITLSASYVDNGTVRTATLPVTISAIARSTANNSITQTTSTVSTTTSTTTTTTTAVPSTTTSTVTATTTTTAVPTTTTTTVSTTTTTTENSNNVSLSKGWNLIGAGGTQSFKASTLFGDKSVFVTVWKWLADRGQWSFYAPSMTATALSDYALAKGYQVLDTIQGSDGFWVNASSATTVSLPFGTAYTAIDHRASLRTGWNLISSGDNLTPVRFNNYLTIYSGSMPPSIGSETTTTVYQDNLTSLWAWDAANSKWFFYAPSLDRSQVLGDYVTGKGYLDFTTQGKKLGSGTGFWVNMPNK